MAYIRSDDAALYYEEYGAGENLLLVPEIFGTIELDWRRRIPGLARCFHVIAVDLRGHGRTNNPSGRLTRELLLSDLHALIDTLEVDRTFVCTTGSMSLPLFMYILERPERVCGLILRLPRLSAFASTGPRFTDEVLQRAHAPGNGPGGWKVLHPEAIGLLHAMEHWGAPDLRAVRVPVLVLTGERSTPGEEADVRRLTDSLSHCTVVTLHGGGRGGSIDAEAEFVEMVATFTARVCGPAAGGV